MNLPHFLALLFSELRRPWKKRGTLFENAPLLLSLKVVESRVSHSHVRKKKKADFAGFFLARQDTPSSLTQTRRDFNFPSNFEENGRGKEVFAPNQCLLESEGRKYFQCVDFLSVFVFPKSKRSIRYIKGKISRLNQTWKSVFSENYVINVNYFLVGIHLSLYDLALIDIISLISARTGVPNCSMVIIYQYVTGT